MAEVRAYFKKTHPLYDKEAKRFYKKVVGKSRNWYLPIINGVPCVDGIHCDIGKSKEYSEGYAGRTIKFEFEDGTYDEVQGPWHSNTDAFFQDTGEDYRDKMLTLGVIYSKALRHDYMTPIIDEKDIYHIDEDWTLGTYTRIDDLAQELANKHNKIMIYYSQSSGGSHAFHKKPQVNEEESN